MYCVGPHGACKIGIKRRILHDIYRYSLRCRENPCMDDFDLKLLDALQEDGRLTNNELGRTDRIVGFAMFAPSRRA